MSFDHGFTRPFSFGAWEVDHDGRAYRYKELYGCVPGEANRGLGLTPAQIGQKLSKWLEPEFREGLHMTALPTRPSGTAAGASAWRSRSAGSSPA